MKKISWIGVLFVLFFLVGLTFAFLYFSTLEENNILSEKLISQTKTLADTKARDSVFTKKNKEYSKIITKYVDGTTFTIEGKKYTSDDLLKLWIEDENRISDLKYKLEVCQENIRTSTNLTNQAIDIAKKTGERANSITKENNQNVRDFNDLFKKSNPGKFREYEFFYNTAKKLYGMDYSVKDNNDSTRILVFKGGEKIDSAMMIYRAYQDGNIRGINQLKKDTERKKTKD